MFPMRGMSPAKLKQMMRQMGIELEELDDVEQVIISTRSREIIFDQPGVVIMKAKGVETFQITGDYVEREKKPPVNEEDVKIVAEQAGVSEEDARKALEETDGDLAEAIMKLTQD